MKIDNENGTALVFVLILLVTGSLLLGSLFVVAQSHINTSNREKAEAKAFYYADSGYEFVKANLNDSKFTELNDGEEKYLAFDNSGNLVFNNSEYFIDSEILGFNSPGLNFSLRAKKDGSVIKFTSTGKYTANNNDFIKIIKFDIKNNRDSFNKVFNIQGSDDSIELKGKAKELNEEFSLLSEDISPTWDKWNEIRESADLWSKLQTSGNNKGKGNSGGNSAEYDGIIARNDGDLKLNNKETFKNSILFIEGDLDINPQISWENSIIVINGDLKFNGFPTQGLVNTVFFVYNDPDNANKREVHIAGSFPEELSSEIDFEKLPIDLASEENNIFVLEVSNWNQGS